MLAIIDYEAGNQTSIQRAYDHLGHETVITADPAVLASVEGIIFPGVGAAGRAMEVLRATGLDRAVTGLVGEGRPFLGICLGCQIMLERSEENDAVTLGVMPGEVVRFSSDLADHDGRPIRIPHMGWNTVGVVKPTFLLEGVRPLDQFYFVHSYRCVPEESLVMGLTWHGLDFASVFGREGLWAVQFHPEKSGPPGLRILSNFRRWCDRAAGR